MTFMKLSSIGKFACAAAVALVIAACSSNKTGPTASKITGSPDEPAWVNSVQAGKEQANAMVVAVGSAKLLDNNMSYATNKATMDARLQIAQTVSASVEQAIKNIAQEDGTRISENTLQAAKQKVAATLQQTQMVERWVDKSSNPPNLYVLVSMDKDSYDKALKEGGQVLKVDEDQLRRISDAVEDMLR